MADTKDNPKPSRPDFSNVRSGSSSTAPSAPGAPGSETTYEVKPGDTLSKIAKQHYGDAGAWHRIYEANKDRIKDPDLIQPGWKLRLP